jgi:hypothetical protein
VALTRCGMLEDVQHEPTISTLLGSFWERPFLLWQLCPAILRVRVEESAFNRATGATSTTEQSRRAAKSARWGGLLTFDGKE